MSQNPRNGAMALSKGEENFDAPKKRERKMIGLELVVELVTAFLWSGQVEGERPLSAILVAPPGSGKTTVLEMLECNTAHFYSDFTSREIVSALNQNQNLTHLMLGDFLSVFGHAKGTVKLSINLIGRLTGDTVRQKPWSGEEIQPRRMGLLTAIPPEDLSKREVRSHIRSGGFASRFIFVKFSYSQKTIERIHTFIRNGNYRKTKPFRVEIKPGQFTVDIPPKIATDVDALARRMTNDPVGFRAHHHLRTLICSIARMNARNTVTVKDYDKLLEFSDFFTEQGKVI